MSDTASPVPTEPGWYLDKDQDVWELAVDGHWYPPCVGAAWDGGGQIAPYAPFTRLVPEAARGAFIAGDEWRSVFAPVTEAAVRSLKNAEPWREPLGALRMTLAGDDPWTLERAREECEELVRVLNGVKP